MSLERHYSPREVAEATGYPLTEIYEAVNSGDLRSRRKRGQTKARIRIPASAVDVWLASLETPAAERSVSSPPTTPTPKPSRTRRRVSGCLADLPLPPGYEPKFSIQ